MRDDQKTNRLLDDRSRSTRTRRARVWSPAYLAIVLLAIPLLCLLWGWVFSWLLRGIK